MFINCSRGIASNSPQAQAALQLIGAFNHSPMAGLVDLRRIDVSSPGVVVATTGQGSEITFGSGKFGATIAALARNLRFGTDA